MALPEIIPVKISSEAAESLSLTPVVVQEMAARDLVGTVLGLTGKDAGRIAELLSRGSFVSGGSRFRWERFSASAADIELVLATFPDPDPARVFVPSRCIRAILSGTSGRIEIAREVGSERRLFAKTSFWDALMELAEQAAPAYAGYSYRHAADRFAAEIAAEVATRLREHASLLRYSSLEAQIRRGRIERLEFIVERT